MSKPTIYFSSVPPKGSVAGLTSESGHIDLLVFKSKKDPAEVCALAATKLRELADAFDRLATMPDPFQEKTQKKAMKVPK
jgi:hypothetical protein